MKTILIAGGSGLVGSRLMEMAQNKGYRVLILSRKKQKRGGYCYWNPQKGKLDEEVIKSCNYIINLAGAGVADKRWNSKRKKELLESRILSTRLLVEYLNSKDHHIEFYLGASAIGYYGDGGNNWQREMDASGNDFLASMCRNWEKEVDNIAKTNINVVLLRIGLVLSKKGGALAKMKTPNKIGIGAYFGNGQQWYSWIHIDDLCAMIFYCLENKLNGIYNAVSPHPIISKNLSKAISLAQKRPFIPISTPKFLVKNTLGEMSTLFFNSNKVSAGKIENTGFKFQFANIDEALAHLS